MIYNYLCTQKVTLSMMRAKTLITVTLAAGLFAACSSDKATKDLSNIQLESELKITGDKTIYGLACEGCNDSTILLLPNDGSDPVKYDIIDATRNHKVRGKIKTGDWICLLTNKHDKHVADFVMDLDQLRGIWCYIVMPKMRDYANMSKRLQARMMENMSDSMKETFLIRANMASGSSGSGKLKASAMSKKAAHWPKRAQWSILNWAITSPGASGMARSSSQEEHPNSAIPVRCQ